MKISRSTGPSWRLVGARRASSRVSALASSAHSRITQPYVWELRNWNALLRLSPHGWTASGPTLQGMPTITVPAGTSLTTVQTLVRERLRVGLDGPLRIELATGVWELEAPLDFGPEDSGTAACARSAIQSPSRRLMFADWNDWVMADWNAPSPTNYPTVSVLPNWAGYGGPRHRSGINICFFDGHTASVPLANATTTIVNPALFSP